MQARAADRLFQQRAARRRPATTTTTTLPRVATGGGRDASALGRAAVSARAANVSYGGGPADAATQKYFPAGADTRPIVLYDGVCNMCNGAVDIMLRLDPAGCFRLAALQSPAGESLLARSGRARDDISSIVLVDRDGFYIRSEAVRRIAAGLGFPPIALAAALAAPVPLPLRDAAYDVIADNRYSIFGRTDECRLEDRSARRVFEERFVTY